MKLTKETPFKLAEKKEPSKLAQKAGAVVNLIKSKKMPKIPTTNAVKKVAVKGLKGGIVGASAAAVNGVVAGAATSAVGALAIGGATATVLSVAPMVAGFSAACIVGNIVADIVGDRETQ